MDGLLNRLQALIEKSRRIVFFGGAGVSTESGIPDFRSEDGLYRQRYDVPPEVMLSHAYFMTHPELFFRFYREKMLVLDAQPNRAHKALAKLEREGKLSAVVRRTSTDCTRRRAVKPYTSCTAAFCAITACDAENFIRFRRLQRAMACRAVPAAE